MPGRELEIADWGTLEYGESRQRQLSLVEKRISGSIPDHLVLVEHLPVVTIGRSGSEADLLISREDLSAKGIGVYRVERGGQATYHGPGQVAAYPIIELREKDLHLFLNNLLETAAAVLRSYGLKPEFKHGRPGLWVNGAKIANVGLAVRRWVTYHGLALNVKPQPSFQWIVPCGRPGQAVTSMEECLHRTVDLSGVKQLLITNFKRTFDYQNRGGKHPAWLVHSAPDQEAVKNLESRLDRHHLATVCQSAHCPNLGECFGRGTATFMILGTRCTRNCRFCAVDKGPPLLVDPEEPDRVARAAHELGLRHVVVTSVTRDDLADGGAEQFVRVIEAIRRQTSQATVEVLVPDFKGSAAALEKVIAAGPDIFNHNLETVARLYPLVRPQARYDRSLGVLEYAARHGPAVKSGLMLGLGETRAEILRALRDLKKAGCRLLTLGQYLAPSEEHAPVARYLSPGEFQDLAAKARDLGFIDVASGPLVRSSYRADEMAFKKTA